MSTTAESAVPDLRPFLRIVRVPYKEPDGVRLLVSASNGRQRGEVEVFANASDLEAVAYRLDTLPEDVGSSVVWEIGSEQPEHRFAFYVRLRVHRVRSTGPSALEIRMNNNLEPPHCEVSEFALTVERADLDRLARLLRQFARLEHRVLLWTVTEGRLEDARP